MLHSISSVLSPVKPWTLQRVSSVFGSSCAIYKTFHIRTYKLCVFRGRACFLFFRCAGVHARRLHVFTLQRQQPRYVNTKVVEVCCFSFCVAAAKCEDRNQTLVWFGCRLMYFVSLKWSKERQTSFTVRRGAHDEELHHFKHANRPFFFFQRRHIDRLQQRKHRWN